MDQDHEITAMARISEVLTGLDEAATGRIIRWAAERYGVQLQTDLNTRGSSNKGAKNSDAADVEFEDVASLFDQANPRTESEKALVVGYWLQKFRGQAALDAQQINMELKHLGHRVKNITDALSSLMNRKPSLVMQIHKSGSTRQARKKYKLTTAGLRKVEDMLSGKSESEE